MNNKDAFVAETELETRTIETAAKKLRQINQDVMDDKISVRDGMDKKAEVYLIINGKK